MPGSGEIELAVIGYLRCHPGAADTLDGIVAWWLPLHRYEFDRMKISGALGEMVDAGVLRCERLPDGADVYSLNHQPQAGPSATKKD